MNSLSQQDLNFVVRRIPSDVRELMQTNYLILGGGFIRETISGGEVNDIDLFSGRHETLNACAQQIAATRQARAHVSENAITVLAPPRVPVQFISRWLYQDASALIKSFDFTVCQAAIWYEPAAGSYFSEVGEGFYRDLAARRLVYTSPPRDEEAGGSMLRACKFLKRGYTIQPSSLGAVIARMASKIREADLPDHDRDEAIARVMTGLLREVDPLLAIDGLEMVEDVDA